MNDFGEKLRTLRKRRGLTLRQLAPLLGVQYSFVGKMERGEKVPNTAMVLKIATFFEVSTDQLMRDQLELE
ncbi:helix-turn-helix transcriptional regulator [Anaerolineales bacterium HSG25]|nr:helix-turn-helix transcriptional regulator [Anaerolineales bacterium HSG25]